MLELIIVASLVALDQIVKWITDLYLMPLGTSVPVWQGVFHFTSAHNTGAAWGMLKGFRWFFVVLTVAVCVLMALFLWRYRKKMHVFSRVLLSLMLAGALGNLIDRLALGYVRDMFDFCLIGFPVFNVADSALSVGCVLLIVDVLFLKDRSLLSMDLKPSTHKTEHGST